MDDPNPSQGSDSLCCEDPKRCRQVGCHLGWIAALIGKWLRAGKFRTYEFDEIFSIAYIEADQLLTKKYEPARATVCTFLSRFLYSRVHYRILVQIGGQRKTRDGWVKPSPLNHDHGIHSKQTESEMSLEETEFVDSIHPDLRRLVVRILDGETIEEIAADEKTLFEESDHSADEIRQMLMSEFRRITQ